MKATKYSTTLTFLIALFLITVMTLSMFKLITTVKATLDTVTDQYTDTRIALR